MADDLVPARPIAPYQRREGAALFAQTDFGYEIIVGPPKGSPLQLTLNTVYHIDQSPDILGVRQRSVG